MLLGGCWERNVITIYNEGDKTWKAVKVSAGGTEHHFDQIESSTKSVYVFKTEVESGGTLIGKLDGMPSNLPIKVPPLSTSVLKT